MMDASCAFGRCLVVFTLTFVGCVLCGTQGTLSPSASPRLSKLNPAASLGPKELCKGFVRSFMMGKGAWPPWCFHHDRRYVPCDKDVLSDGEAGDAIHLIVQYGPKWSVTIHPHAPTRIGVLGQ